MMVNRLFNYSNRIISFRDTWFLFATLWHQKGRDRMSSARIVACVSLVLLIGCVEVPSDDDVVGQSVSMNGLVQTPNKLVTLLGAKAENPNLDNPEDWEFLHFAKSDSDPIGVSSYYPWSAQVNVPAHIWRPSPEGGRVATLSARLLEGNSLFDGNTLWTFPTSDKDMFDVHMECGAIGQACCPALQCDDAAICADAEICEPLEEVEQILAKSQSLFTKDLESDISTENRVTLSGNVYEITDIESFAKNTLLMQEISEDSYQEIQEPVRVSFGALGSTETDANGAWSFTIDDPENQLVLVHMDISRPLLNSVPGEEVIYQTLYRSEPFVPSWLTSDREINSFVYRFDTTNEALSEESRESAVLNIYELQDSFKELLKKDDSRFDDDVFLVSIPRYDRLHLLIDGMGNSIEKRANIDMDMRIAAAGVSARSPKFSRVKIWNVDIDLESSDGGFFRGLLKVVRFFLPRLVSEKGWLDKLDFDQQVDDKVFSRLPQINREVNKILQDNFQSIVDSIPELLEDSEEWSVLPPEIQQYMIDRLVNELSSTTMFFGYHPNGLGELSENLPAMSIEPYVGFPRTIVEPLYVAPPESSKATALAAVAGSDTTAGIFRDVQLDQNGLLSWTPNRVVLDMLPLWPIYGNFAGDSDKPDWVTLDWEFLREFNERDDGKEGIMNSEEEIDLPLRLIVDGDPDKKSVVYWNGRFQHKTASGSFGGGTGVDDVVALEHTGYVWGDVRRANYEIKLFRLEGDNLDEFNEFDLWYSEDGFLVGDARGAFPKIVVGDLNTTEPQLDGLAIAWLDSNKLVFLEGKPGNATAHTHILPDIITGLVVGDFNGDGKRDDIVVRYDWNDPLVLYTGGRSMKKVGELPWKPACSGYFFANKFREDDRDEDDLLCWGFGGPVPEDENFVILDGSSGLQAILPNVNLEPGDFNGYWARAE